MTLRFIDSGAGDAAANMALDESLAWHLARQHQCGYIRFYRWEPPALSFGYNQRIERLVSIEAIKNSGIGIVRRMSGGKMVFHADEHTFSLGLTAEFIRTAIGNSATFLEMFKFAVEPMVTALIGQGVPARFSSAREMSAGKGNHLHCYAAAAGHSIFAGQHKLIGAAGVFRDECLIIHGSIPISISKPPDHLFNCEHRSSLDVDMASLSDFLTPEAITRLPVAIAQIYAASFSCQIQNSLPDHEEITMAAKLALEKYANLNWNSLKSVA